MQRDLQKRNGQQTSLKRGLRLEYQECQHGPIPHEQTPTKKTYHICKETNKKKCAISSSKRVLRLEY